MLKDINLGDPLVPTLDLGAAEGAGAVRVGGKPSAWPGERTTHTHLLLGNRNVSKAVGRGCRDL